MLAASTAADRRLRFHLSHVTYALIDSVMLRSHQRQRGAVNASRSPNRVVFKFARVPVIPLQCTSAINDEGVRPVPSRDSVQRSRLREPGISRPQFYSFHRKGVCTETSSGAAQSWLQHTMYVAPMYSFCLASAKLQVILSLQLTKLCQHAHT